MRWLVLYAFVCACPVVAAARPAADDVDESLGAGGITMRGSISMRSWRPRFDRRSAQLTTVLDIQTNSASAACTAQIRHRAGIPAQDVAAALGIDELYLSRPVVTTSRTTLGRRKIDSGFAMGYSPSDFLNQDVESNRELLSEDARIERPGRDMVAFQHWEQNRSLLVALVRPRDSARQADLLLLGESELGSADLAFSVFAGDRPGWGLGLRTTLDPTTVIYADFAMQRGPRSGASQLRPELTLGAQYQSAAGFGLLFELWLNPVGLLPAVPAAITSAPPVPLPSPCTQLRCAPTAVFLRLSDVSVNLRPGIQLDFEQILVVDSRPNPVYSRSILRWSADEKTQLTLMLDHDRSPRATSFGPADAYRLGVDLKRLF